MGRGEFAVEDKALEREEEKGQRDERLICICLQKNLWSLSATEGN